MLVSLAACRAGYRPARWFTLAWSVLTVTVLAHFLGRLGLAPSNTLTEHGYQFGMVALAVLMSLGLAERIRDLERNRQHALMALTGVQRASTLGEMAASIAHELNQPLAAISANCGAVRLWLSSDKDRTIIETRVLPIVDQLSADALRAGETLKRLRALFERGQSAIGPVDINATVRETVAMMQSDQSYADLQLDIQPTSTLPLVSADASQIQQVLMNLISNAAEAGSSAIRIETTLSADDEILVTVSDNGSGIDAGVGEQVFAPFYSGRADGMGMGLAICSTIIRGHGGRLWHQPGNPCGCQFLFTLPLAGRRHAPDPPAVPVHTETPPRSFP